MLGSAMRTAVLVLCGMAGLAGIARSDDDKPIYPPPKSMPKFTEVQVRMEHDPTVVPLEVESRIRWWTERELARAKPTFATGRNGLAINIKFLHFIEPQQPFPSGRVPHGAPGPSRRGQVYIGPEAEMQPIPPLGQARIQLTFTAPDGTQLAQFDFVEPVPLRHQLDNETGYIAHTAKIATHYARHYFLGEKTETNTPRKK